MSTQLLVFWGHDSGTCFPKRNEMLRVAFSFPEPEPYVLLYFQFSKSSLPSVSLRNEKTSFL